MIYLGKSAKLKIGIELVYWKLQKADERIQRKSK